MPLRDVHRIPSIAAIAALALAPSCSKTEGPASPAPSSTVDLPISAPLPPESPLSVVLTSRTPLVLSSLEGGIFIADAAHGHLARASAAGGELTAEPMPEGLPATGHVLAAAGRLPSPIWLLYETPKGDGKGHENPLFRLGKEGWKKYADDWKPSIAAWTKRRILAASTSSGRLKIKVIEPSLATAPADLPSPHLGDASCEKTIRVEALAALPTGEVFAAGSCKPDVAAAGASTARYVVIRWPVPGAVAVDGGVSDAGTLDAGPVDAGSAPAAMAPDAGAGAADAGTEPAESAGPPGVVDVIPGVSTRLVYEALYARGPGDVWVAAREPAGAGVSRLFHFDGATWGPVALPEGTTGVRGIAATADGTLWMATARAVLRRDPAGTWSEVPPPERGLPDGTGTWEMLGLAATDGRDVWIAARRTSAAGARDLVIRTRPSPAVVRWE